MGRSINARRCPRGPRGRGRALDPRGHPVRQLEPFFLRKKANIRIEVVSKIQPNRSYGSPVIKETVKGQKLERRNKETDAISEGISPLPCHGDQGPEGKPFSHLGRRSRKNKKEGGYLSLASAGAKVSPGAIIVTAIFTSNFTAIITTSSPLYAAV